MIQNQYKESAGKHLQTVSQHLQNATRRAVLLANNMHLGHLIHTHKICDLLKLASNNNKSNRLTQKCMYVTIWFTSQCKHVLCFLCLPEINRIGNPLMWNRGWISTAQLISNRSYRPSSLSSAYLGCSMPHACSCSRQRLAAVQQDQSQQVTYYWIFWS